LTSSAIRFCLKRKSTSTKSSTGIWPSSRKSFFASPSAVETKKFLLKFGKPEPKVKDELDEIARQDAVENYSQKEMLKWALSLGMPLPGQEPEVDTSPVKTMLPPNMRGMTVKKQEDVPPGAPPVVATPAAPLPPALPEVAPSGPIGGKRRIGRGHRTDRSADGG
jgi:hypothetical protein